MEQVYQIPFDIKLRCFYYEVLTVASFGLHPFWLGQRKEWAIYACKTGTGETVKVMSCERVNI